MHRRSAADGTELTVRVQIAALAATGPRLVQVVTPSGQTSGSPTSANQFTLVREISDRIDPIMAPSVGVVVGSTTMAGGTSSVGPIQAPAVGVLIGAAAQAINPSVGVTGTSLTLTVTGVGLQSVQAVTASPQTGLTIGTVTVNAGGTRAERAGRNRRRRAAHPAPCGVVDGRGPHGVRPRPTRTSSAWWRPSPEVYSVAPQVLAAGQTVTLTLRGRNFSDVQAVQIDPAAGITVAPVFAVTEGNTVMRVVVQVSAGAASGSRLVVVHTAGGNSGLQASAANTIQIAQQVGPTYEAIMALPVGVVVGSAAGPQSSQTFSAYAPAVGVVFDGGTAPPPSQEQGVFAANVGVVVGTAIGSMEPRAPEGFLKGATGSLEIYGLALGAVNSVSIMGSGASAISPGAFNVNGAGTVLTVPLNITASAVSGTYGIALSGNVGTSTQRITAIEPGKLFFRVGALPTLLDSVTPIVLEQGKSYTFTVRGENLKDVYRVLADPADGVEFGFDLAEPQWTSDVLGEKLTVRVLVSPQAPVGSRAIRLKVPGGTTSAEPLPANTITVVAQ